MAVQWGNLNYINPKTNQRVQVDELYQFATGYLNVDYISWGMQEPYYSRDVIPFINTISKH